MKELLMMSGSTLDNVAGGVYGGVVDAELARQRDRESAVRQRGAMVASTAGVLVTLILALAGVTRPTTTLVTSGGGKALLDIGLVCFVIAAGLGMVVNLPWPSWPSLVGMIRRTGRSESPHAAYATWVATLASDPKWWGRHDLAEVAQEVAGKKIEFIQKLEKKNDQRNWLLAAAIIAVLAATACLAVSVMLSLR